MLRQDKSEQLKKPRLCKQRACCQGNHCGVHVVPEGMGFEWSEQGDPAQTVRHRTDAKLYRLQTPQTPIARTKRYDEYHMDEFPSGTNMIVAVLAYTGICPLSVRVIYPNLGPLVTGRSQCTNIWSCTVARVEFGSCILPGMVPWRSWDGICPFKAFQSHVCALGRL